MKEIIKKLSAPLPMQDIDWRIGMLGKSKKGVVYATLLAYKDSRVDQQRLDDATDGLWQNLFKRDTKGVLQCGIGIYSPEIKEWIWKYSNGIESNNEAVKGEYSDAFKRAGFMWGIGRELYDMPTVFIFLDQEEYYMQGDKVKASKGLKLNEWQFLKDNGKLVIRDNKKKIRYQQK